MEKQFRYPGTRPFQEGDRNLFFGRNADIRNLTELIVLEKLVVLFSKSGYGKSSLLNAGVIPKLTEQEKFQVINVRLNEQAKNPVRLLGFHLSSKGGKSDFLTAKFNIPKELPNDLTAILWFYCKSIQLAENSFKGLILVFDQFEELFNFSNSEIEDFARTLATLLNLNMPESIRKLLKKILESDKSYFTEEETDQLLEPLNLKVVFSLRSDRLSLLNQLKGTLPAVFKKTYELQPLDENQALEALLEPADKAGDFASPIFTYSEDAIALILNSLKDKEDKRIETFQLQLICQHAEELIIVKAEAKSNRLELTATDLGNPEDIFENHYNTIIGSLPADSQLKARILIEDKLIIGGNRVPLPESVIIEEHQVPADLLITLVDKRLLRSEPNTVGGMSFELSHDTLVAPIQKTAKTRRIQEAEERAEKDRLEKVEIQRKLRKTRILLGTAVLTLFFAVIAIFFAFDQRNKAKKQAATSKALLLAYSTIELLDDGKEFLAFRIAEAAYETALNANPHPPTIFLKALSNAFYYSSSLQISYFNGHQEDVTSVAFSPFGNYLLTGSWDKTAILWDNRGNQIQEFKGHQDGVTSVAFSSDGKFVLTGSRDKSAILWDTHGMPILKIEGHLSSVTSVAFSPDGNSLLTGSSDKTAILWDTQGNQIQKYEGHQGDVLSVAFSPDGNFLLTGSIDNVAILWNINGKMHQKFKGHRSRVSSVTFSPDGNSLLTGSWDKTVILWDINGMPIQHFAGHQNFINSVAFSPDGNSVLTGSSDNTAILWSIYGKQLQKFEGHLSSVTSVSFSPDGNSLLTASNDNTTILWGVNGKPIQKFEGHRGRVTSGIISPDGNFILTGSRDISAILWDKNGNQVKKFTGLRSRDMNSTAFAPDGKYLLTAGSYDKTAIMWDTSGKQIQKFEGHERVVSSIAFAPDGNSVLTGSWDKTAILWDTKGNPIQKFEGHEDSLSSVAFSPNGKLILTGSMDKTAILWDIKGNIVKKLEGHRQKISSVAFSPNGNYLLTGSWDRTAILWNIGGEMIQKFERHKSVVFSVAFSPDSNYLLTGSDDKTAILWDIKGKPIQKFEGHKGMVSSVSFSPDGNSILTGSYDYTAILWKTPQGIFNWLQSPDCPLRQLTEEEKVLYGIIEGKD